MDETPFFLFVFPVFWLIHERINKLSLQNESRNNVERKNNGKTRWVVKKKKKKMR